MAVLVKPKQWLVTAPHPGYRRWWKAICKSINPVRCPASFRQPICTTAMAYNWLNCLKKVAAPGLLSIAFLLSSLMPPLPPKMTAFIATLALIPCAWRPQLGKISRAGASFLALVPLRCNWRATCFWGRKIATIRQWTASCWKLGWRRS